MYTLHVGMTSWKMDFMLSVRDHAYSTLALHLGMMSCLQLPHKDHAYSSVSCFHVCNLLFDKDHAFKGMISCLQKHDVMLTCNTLMESHAYNLSCLCRHDLCFLKA